MCRYIETTEKIVPVQVALKPEQGAANIEKGGEQYQREGCPESMPIFLALEFFLNVFISALLYLRWTTIDRRKSTPPVRTPLLCTTSLPTPLLTDLRQRRDDLPTDHAPKLRILPIQKSRIAANIHPQAMCDRLVVQIR